MLSDGERLVGVPDFTGMPVLDAVTGRRGYVRSPPGCTPAGVGGGAVAFACTITPNRAGGAGVVVDLVLRAYRSAVDMFVARGTTQLVPGARDTDTALDLDARTPWRRMCRPLRARTGIDALGADGAILPYAYRPPVRSDGRLADRDRRAVRACTAVTRTPVQCVVRMARHRRRRRRMARGVTAPRLPPPQPPRPELAPDRLALRADRSSCLDR